MSKRPKSQNRQTVLGAQTSDRVCGVNLKAAIGAVGRCRACLAAQGIRVLREVIMEESQYLLAILCCGINFYCDEVQMCGPETDGGDGGIPSIGRQGWKRVDFG